MKKTKTTPEPKFTTRAKDVPVAQGMLHLVRAELKADIKKVETSVHAVEANLRVVESNLMSAIHQVASEVARVGMLVEEQNSRNNLVLEGLTGLFERQTRVEHRVDGVEEMVRSLGRSAR